MEFNSGDFIFHNYHGVGRILETADLQNSISTDSVKEYTIRFQDGTVRTLTQELVDRGAHKISAEGFKAYWYLDETRAKELLIADPVEVITLVLHDFRDEQAKNEDFKDYLAPYVKDWAEWWDITQPKLKDSPLIDTSRSKLRIYGLRRDALSRAEEIYRSFNRFRSQDKALGYNEARRVLTEYRTGASLSEEHLEDVLHYVKLIIELETIAPELRLDALFRLREGKWLTIEEVEEYVSKIILSGLKLYQLDLFALNRTVEYLFSLPLTMERSTLLASAICSEKEPIKAVSEWALRRGETNFIALLLIIGLSENIPPQLEIEKFDTLAVRLQYLGNLAKGLEARNQKWNEIISHLHNFILEISKHENKVAGPLLPALLDFSNVVYERLELFRPNLALEVLEGLLNRANPGRFVLGLIDTARKHEHLTSFQRILEQRLWLEGENRNYDFLRELSQIKGTTIEQVKSLMEMVEHDDSAALKSHVGEIICDLIRKDDATDRILFLPDLNRLYDWGGRWSWSDTLAGLRETIYFNALERSQRDFGDDALKSAVYRFIATRTDELEREVEHRNVRIQQANQRISELEGLLSDREQVIRELRSGYGGDTADARFSERVRIVKEIASSIAEFERMELKMTEKSREVQAIITRLESILSGLNIMPMESVGSQVKFSPQKHHVVDTTAVNVGDTVVIVERGYLIRDNKEKFRLLKPALVKK